MTPLPPPDLPPELRCSLHACCRGDVPGQARVEAERAHRLQVLGDALGCPVAPPEARSPARIRVGLRPDAQGRLGFSAPRSHRIQPVAWCGLAHPRLQALMALLPAMPPDLDAVELRTDGQRVVLAAWSRAPRLARRLGAALKALALPVDGLALDGRCLQGDTHIELEVAGIRHRLGPETFSQVQMDCNQDLVAFVMDQAPGRPAVLDLYAGCGNLGLPLAARGCPLTMIESSPAACADAAATAARHGLTVDIRQGDAGAFQAGDAFFELALLDPPRAGAAGVLAQVVLTRPERVVVVSCNPGLLARDLRPAREAGYRLSTVRAFDMFPGTEHLEVVAVLDRP